MSIEINKPIILADTQTVSCTGFNMHKSSQGWQAIINFTITDGVGNFVKDQTITIIPEKWNEFWESFTSGTFLYEQYVPEAKNLDADFSNTIPEPVSSPEPVVEQPPQEDTTPTLDPVQQPDPGIIYDIDQNGNPVPVV